MKYSNLRNLRGIPFCNTYGTLYAEVTRTWHTWYGKETVEHLKIFRGPHRTKWQDLNTGEELPWQIVHLYNAYEARKAIEDEPN